jgi:hypothetical protein
MSICRENYPTPPLRHPRPFKVEHEILYARQWGTKLTADLRQAVYLPVEQIARHMEAKTRGFIALVPPTVHEYRYHVIHRDNLCDGSVPVSPLVVLVNRDTGQVQQREVECNIELLKKRGLNLSYKAVQIITNPRNVRSFNKGSIAGASISCCSLLSVSRWGIKETEKSMDSSSSWDTDLRHGTRCWGGSS